MRKAEYQWAIRRLRSKWFRFRAIWCHKLQRRHIRNRLIKVRKGCTFHRCI